MQTDKTGPKVTCLGQVAVLAFLAACVGGAYWLYSRTGAPASGATQPQTAVLTSDPRPNASGPRTKIGIAYGTEKERWLKLAVEQFQKTPKGANIEIELIPMGSIEGGQAVLAGDTRFQVWSPASSLYTDVVEQEWKLRHTKSPFQSQDSLALSPMVFVFWKERAEEFVRKYGAVSFQSISKALAEPGGWDSIAGKPEWGLFKFGHTHPNESNSGLMTLVLLAYNYSGKTQDLTLKNILDPGFQTWMSGIERGVTGLSNSTGNMMKQMVLRGPASFDALFVYENVAIDYLKNAEGRWGELALFYPPQNMWNENPYYILDVPWSDTAQRIAAAQFLDFLLSEPVQKESLQFGFRPGNPAVPIKFAGSPFVDYASYGVKSDLGAVCDPPRSEVLTNLLEIWQRTSASRSR